MSFNKRYITKSAIISCPDQKSLLKLLKVDALICDMWATNFLQEFDYHVDIYQETRKVLEEKTKFFSGNEFTTHPEYKTLESLGNTYFNLKSKEANWIDISLALDKIKTPIPQDILGYVDEMKKFCIREIEKYFD